MEQDHPHLHQEDVTYWMKQALKQAKKAQEADQVPVGCVFVRRIEGTYTKISSSHNLTNQHQNASRHCQINCLIQMQKAMTKQEISSCILFVTVQPCIMCTHALNLMGIRLVYFGQYNDKFGGCGSLRRDHQFAVFGGIMQRQSFQIIRNFYEKGNQRLPEDMRNRKKKIKPNQQQ